MKAAVYYETGGPEVFRYEDVPDPVPGRRGPSGPGRGDQYRGGRHAGTGHGRARCAAPHRRIPVRRDRRRHRGRRGGILRRRPGRDRRPRRVSRRAPGRADAILLAGAAGPVPRRSRLCPRAFRDRRRLPLRIRTTPSGGDRAGARWREWCGDRRHPTGEPGRCAGACHRLQRREAVSSRFVRAWTTGSTTSRRISSTRSAG